MKPRRKEPLYRKENNRTYNLGNRPNEHFRYYRHTTRSDQTELEKMKKRGKLRY